MYIDLSKQPLPKVYKKEGKDCYLDPVRKKLIYITPEETVRQQVLSYLQEELEIPREMISVEDHLSHYGLKSTRRADIIVKCYTKKNELIPVAVIECKAPGVGLGEKGINQMVDYSEALGCDYAMLINDSQYFCYHYDEKRSQYIQIEALPSYKDIIKNRYKAYQPEPFPERVPHNKVSAFLKETLDEYSLDISPKTEHKMACAAFNLMECTLDPRHKLPDRPYKLFRLIEDYGVRMLSYGNASGGIFYGPYRSFLIDVNGSAEFVSIGFSTYGSYSDPEINKTVINVAIDREKEAHHSLQLVMDDNVMLLGEKITFYHHGRIAVGNKGSGKVAELREFVKERYPQILDGKKFNLGSLTDDHNWNLDEPDVVAVMENLISYALIRDEYRAFIKKNLS